MRNPYTVDGPTAVSFSGGRTSAFMARQVQLANPGKPITYLFANTGKEREETLRFVERCDQEWGLGLVWLEFSAEAPGFAVVDFASASRQGEPFAAIIQARQYLPNPVTRFCTVELKIRTMHRYLKSLGWADEAGEWDQMIGLRADEHRRVATIRRRGTSSETPREHMRLPLADAGVTLVDIDRFWREQSFGLELPTINGKTLLGNCDLCFLKGRSQVYSIIQSDLRSADWWSAQELSISTGGRAALFRFDRPSYTQMQAYARQQHVLFADAVDDAIDCYCGA
ncbi:phosphoadenosine phosphosulfate reductase family protein [uncultured Pseudomonas sp.]|uniref:phosphoadenosine phosphosulfate reductase family protein n=1 Tax=uncultured Pseudomonas sp. TaxID=114707 RepID=UPI0025E0187B|nr:phosphoadenosine phosphosulfate reductase family protein [uncultured Pseudomonas sp.]